MCQGLRQLWVFDSRDLEQQVPEGLVAHGSGSGCQGQGVRVHLGEGLEVEKLTPAGEEKEEAGNQPSLPAPRTPKVPVGDKICPLGPKGLETARAGSACPHPPHLDRGRLDPQLGSPREESPLNRCRDSLRTP